MAKKASCSVVDARCMAPANSTEECWVRTECFSCGETVCKECSSIRKYSHYGLRRLCNNCQIEHDGDEARVLLRSYHQAGYTHMTLADVREKLESDRKLIDRLHQLQPPPQRGARSARR